MPYLFVGIFISISNNRYIDKLGLSINF